MLRRTSSTLLFISGLLLFALTDLPAQPRARALLVGISEYERGGTADWWNLNSLPDVEALRAVMTGTFGVKPEDVVVLTSREQTTAASIIGTFRKHLIEGTQPGDVIYFHYSGHGAQELDTGGDEIDGLDETLIPSDYKSRRDHSADISDDVLATLTAELRAKSPGVVLMTFDCCFSGTNTRGGRMLVRGEGWKGERPKQRARGAGEEGPSGLSPGAGDHFVVIAATRSDQVASETEDDAGKAMGLLSYALSRSLPACTPTTTYRDLFERVVDLMSRRSRDQQPQLEGNMDKVVMSGRALKPEPYVGVSIGAKNRLLLHAGQLHGVTVGSRYALFPPGTKDFAAGAPLGETTVEAVDLTTSSLAPLAKGMGNLNPEEGVLLRAVEREHRYEDNRLAVTIAGAGDAAGLQARLKALPLVNLVNGDTWDVRLRTAEEGRGSGDLIIERKDGSLIATVPASGDPSPVVARALEGESRWRFLQALESDDPASDVRIALRVVPVDVDLDARGNPRRVTARKELPRNAGGAVQMTPGTYFIIELANEGRADAYVTVLDLRGDGRVGPLWPDPTERNDNNMVPADSKWHSVPLSTPAAPWIFIVEDMPGTEVIKAIATREQTDFSPLLDPEMVRGARGGEESPASKTPLGQLLKAATAGQRAARASVDPAEWATSSTTFRVMEKE